MKLLLLIFKDIKNFIIKESRIFIILFIGLVMASLSFLILFSLCVSSRAEHQKEFGYKTKTYRIEFSEFVNNQTKYDLIEKLQQAPTYPKVDELSIYSHFKSSDRGSINIIGYYANRDFFYCTEGRTFTADEQENATKVIIPCLQFLDYGKQKSYVGEIFSIGNNSYKIIGVAEYSTPNTVYLPLETCIKDKYNILNLSITFNKRIDNNKVIEFKNLISNYDQNATIIMPPAIDIDQERNLFITFIQYFIILIFALVNIISLFTFWVFKNMSQFVIFKLCGAKNATIYWIIIIESLVLTTMFYSMASIVYYILIPYLPGILNSLKTIHYLISFFLILFIIFILVNRTAYKVISLSNISNN